MSPPLDRIDFYGRHLALWSFLLGSLIFLIFHGGWHDIMFVGMYYVLVATVINAVMLFWALILALFNAERRFEHLKTAGIILLNIPVAIFYFYLVIYVVD